MESINKALSPLLVVFNWYVLPVFSLGVRVTAALLWLFSSSGSDIFWDQGKKNELFAESFSQILIQPHNWVVQTVGLLHFWNVNVNMKFWFFKLFVYLEQFKTKPPAPFEVSNLCSSYFMSFRLFSLVGNIAIKTSIFHLFSFFFPLHDNKIHFLLLPKTFCKHCTHLLPALKGSVASLFLQSHRFHCKMMSGLLSTVALYLAEVSPLY